MTETKQLITHESLEALGFIKNPRHSKEYNFKKLRVKLLNDSCNLWVGKELISSIKYVDEIEKYL